MSETSAPPIRVLVVDDEPLLRAAFEALVNAQDDMECVGVAPDGAAAITTSRALSPDVVLMDLQMPHVDGVAATRAICRDASATRVVVLTAYDVEANLFAALQAGACGFLAKDCLADEVLHAVRVAHRGDSLIAPHLVKHLVQRVVRSVPAEPGTRPRHGSLATPLPADLTARELDLVRAVARGLSNDEVAAELRLTPQTVKTYVSRLLAKLGCRDRAQLVIFAYENAVV
ncbi:DNA-binding response regulator, NarL/FixJ family, contains REC and HTH domains [Quadrisphaera granulorum]|uniref:DNA-binding NarL/FixJ family response regulator n=1 Tax=Quadrisphaera granulorum TaxID=317664 RepID=A0A316AU70_9ACTN|nr:response regulator transcription factor [Quadrisphaera granulorum]PWJ53707.1 DNA-binding NarL/FixJ family response regulator [Quadrisphaera granulorum]SZE96751.1 DNA-binding response regulator, NarL/FixJ family, contains REC and HTH domains [Quadrisphaera granulorum]